MNDRSFTDAELDLLNKSLATLVLQIDEHQLLGKPPVPPKFDVRALCRLRMKIDPTIGISETIDSL